MTQDNSTNCLTDKGQLLKNADISPLDSVAVVLPAAGIGSRMNSEIPKQYLTLGDYTIIEHTIQRLLQVDPIVLIVVALHPTDQAFHQLPIAADPQVQTVVGGETRADSVLAGLRHIESKDFPWVLVHDAARPNVKTKDVIALLDHCSKLSIDKHQAGAILAAKVRDTIKHGKSEISHTVDRKHLWQAFTPQCCRTYWLTKALEHGLEVEHQITDEASALELAGYKVDLVAGDPWNIKVTQPEDLQLMSLLLSMS